MTIFPLNDAGTHHRMLNFATEEVDDPFLNMYLAEPLVEEEGEERGGLVMENLAIANGGFYQHRQFHPKEADLISEDEGTHGLGEEDGEEEQYSLKESEMPLEEGDRDAESLADVSL